MRAYLTAEWGKAVARPYYRIYLAVMVALAAALARTQAERGPLL